jgi:predicted RNA-binding Zn ribbon-like protein
MSAYPYELVGGHPVLDFLNTVRDWKAADVEDRLNGFSDVVGFAVAAGVLKPAEAARFSARAAAPAIVRQLRELRAVLARVMESVIASTTPAQADLDFLAREAARAAAVATLRGSRRGVSRIIDVEDVGPDVVRWRLADAAVELLGSEAMSQVKSCSSCGWFFLDTSKNRSRRWCSMQMCGSAVKSRRYYYRYRQR